MAGYLVGITISLMTANRYSGFIGSHTMNMAEAFVENYMSLGNISLMLFGFCLVMSDAPFVYADSFMMIHRSGRLQWYKAMWLYIAAQGLLYYGSSLLVSILYNIRKSYVANVWSLPLQSGNETWLSNYNIQMHRGDFLTNFTPYSAMLHTLLLILLYSLFLVGIMYAFNMYRSGAWGTLAAAMVHLLGMAISSVSVISRLAQWLHWVNGSLFGVAGYGISLFHAYIWMALSLYVVYILGSFAALRTDFNLTESGAVNE